MDGIEKRDKVSKVDFNGRQIKNAVRVAYARALNDQRKLRPEHIYSVLEALKSFENDFRDHSVKRALASDSTDPGNKRARVMSRT